MAIYRCVGQKPGLDGGLKTIRVQQGPVLEVGDNIRIVLVNFGRVRDWIAVSLAIPGAQNVLIARAKAAGVVCFSVDADGAAVPTTGQLGVGSSEVGCTGH